MVRTTESVEELKALAAQGTMSVVNAMTDSEHPSQAIADLSAIKEAFGRLEGLHILHVGEGNNTAASQVLAIAQIPGIARHHGHPQGLRPRRRRAGAGPRSGQEERRRRRGAPPPRPPPREVDVVYTTRWTVGAPKIDADWATKFRPYAITRELMAEVSIATGGTIFLHDLRAMRASR